jgi:low affinity Fe/Cu permease
MKKNKNFFEQLAIIGAKFTGSTAAFIISLISIIIWLLVGPIFHFSDSWQLIMNTVTSIITFLMVFLIQRSQNKDSRAIHIKLNELISSIKKANNKIIDVEDLSEAQLNKLTKYYEKFRKKS